MLAASFKVSDLPHVVARKREKVITMFGFMQRFGPTWARNEAAPSRQRPRGRDHKSCELIGIVQVEKKEDAMDDVIQEERKEDAMDELTRRRALKLAASTGVAAVAAAVAGGPAAQAQEGLRAQPPGFNDGIAVDDVSGLAIPSGQYGYAVVNSNGTVARGHHAMRSDRLSLGHYEVIFDSNVRGGAYIATIGLSGSTQFSPPGQITVAGRLNNVNGVFITTSDASGKPTDMGFHLGVLT
jgi:hypothetical protein